MWEKGGVGHPAGCAIPLASRKSVAVVWFPLAAISMNVKRSSCGGGWSWAKWRSSAQRIGGMSMWLVDCYRCRLVRLLHITGDSWDIITRHVALYHSYRDLWLSISVQSKCIGRCHCLIGAHWMGGGQSLVVTFALRYAALAVCCRGRECFAGKSLATSAAWHDQSLQLTG